MNAKQKRKVKLIQDYRREIRELMDKYNISSFLADLRIHKLAFTLSYAEFKGEEKFLKRFKKDSDEERRNFLDDKIPPFFCWHEGEIEEEVKA
jgi:hypothetical protein